MIIRQHEKHQFTVILEEDDQETILLAGFAKFSGRTEEEALSKAITCGFASIQYVYDMLRST